MEHWVSEWALQNPSWERVWVGVGRRIEVLRLLEDFYSEPSYEGAKEGEVVLRLRVRSESKMWKDWMVKLVEDFCAAHPGAALLNFESV